MSFENSGLLDIQFKYEQKIFKFNVNSNSPPSLSTLISFIGINLMNIPITNYNSLQLIFSNEQPKLLINLDTDESIKLMLNQSKEHSINPINIDIIINEQNNYEENQNKMDLINGEELLWSTIIRPNNSDPKCKGEITEPKIVKQKNNLKILSSQNTEEVKDNIVTENLKQELKLQKTPLIMCSVCNTTLINKWFICIICDNLSLCKSCGNQHTNSHPLLCIRDSPSSSINSLNDLFFYYKATNAYSDLQTKAEKKKFLLTSGSHKAQISLTLHSLSNKISMLPESNETLSIVIENNYDKEIMLNLILRNSIDVLIKCDDSFELKKGELKMIELQISTPKNPIKNIYDILIELFCLSNDLDYKPISFMIYVDSNNDIVDKNNVNFFFENTKNICKLPFEKKKVLYDMIKNNEFQDKKLEKIDKKCKDKNDFDKVMKEIKEKK